MFDAGSGSDSDYSSSEYFKMISEFSGDLAKNFGDLPTLDISPTWWMMPWAEIPKRRERASREGQEDKAKAKIRKMHRLYMSVLNHGYSVVKSGAIDGYLLVHPEKGQVFNQIDGHHRVCVLNYLRSTGRIDIDKVCVNPIKVIHRDRLLSDPLCREGVAKGLYTDDDALALFDNVFDVASRQRLKNSF